METNSTQVQKIAKDSALIDLFEHRNTLNEEINRRAKLVLMELGYDWYKLNSITVGLFDRKNVKLAHIKAFVEVNFEQTEIEVDVPVRQFEHLLLIDS
jgi:hypothetical protein